jgi:hypothetical protein
VLICKVGSVLCGIPPIAFSTEALYVATPWHTAPTDNEVIRMHAQHTETKTHTNAYASGTLFWITYVFHERVLGQVQVKAWHPLHYGVGHHDVCEGADHAVPVPRAGPGGQPATLFVRVQPACVAHFASKDSAGEI